MCVIEVPDPEAMFISLRMGDVFASLLPLPPHPPQMTSTVAISERMAE